MIWLIIAASVAVIIPLIIAIALALQIREGEWDAFNGALRGWLFTVLTCLGITLVLICPGALTEAEWVGWVFVGAAGIAVFILAEGLLTLLFLPFTLLVSWMFSGDDDDRAFWLGCSVVTLILGVLGVGIFFLVQSGVIPMSINYLEELFAESTIAFVIFVALVALVVIVLPLWLLSAFTLDRSRELYIPSVPSWVPTPGRLYRLTAANIFTKFVTVLYLGGERVRAWRCERGGF